MPESLWAWEFRAGKNSLAGAAQKLLPSLFIKAQADTKHLIPPEKPETKEIPRSGEFGGTGDGGGTCGAALQISTNICL